MLTHIRELVHDAIARDYAVGAFNVENVETTLAVIQAAVQEKSPVILQVSETTIAYAGLKVITSIVEHVARDVAGMVPVALHLDHGKSFRSVAACVQAGFSSIMIDASDVPFQENVILTKQAVDYAHRKEVWVQGELGAVKGLEEAMTLAEREPFMTKPEEAKQFVEETGVDTLAVAVGNVHGVVKMRKGMTHAIDFDRLDEIQKVLPNTPLVLHGASGISVETLQESFQHGIRIVNMNTELKLAFVNALRSTLQKDSEAYDPRALFKPSMDALQDLVAAKLRALKSTGKANH